MQQNFVSTTFSLEMLGEKLLVCFLRMLGGREGGGSEFQKESHVLISISLWYLHFSSLLSQFQAIFVSFVTIILYMAKFTWKLHETMLPCSCPPRVSMWCGWGFRVCFSLLAVFTDFAPTLPIPLGMVSTVCSKNFSFHWFSVWRCLVVAAHRVVMDTLCIRLCLSYGFTLFRHHDPRSSIVVGVNHLVRVTVSRPYHTCKKCTCKILS